MAVNSIKLARLAPLFVRLETGSNGFRAN